MPFITLTDTDGLPCLINVDYLTHAVQTKRGGKTVVSMNSPHEYVDVLENPEEIYALIPQEVVEYEYEYEVGEEVDDDQPAG